jgi:transcriptional regulator with XRE-family HTH domain
MINFREKLRTLMTAHAVSQMQLSIATGVRQAAISNFLSGKKNLRSDQLEKLFNYFETQKNNY